MDIAVLYDDGTEAEFELDFCCASCANEQWGWSGHQYDKAYRRVISNEPIKLPNNIKTNAQLKKYLMNI